LGRLTEAETDNCGNWPPKPITDKWFSYSPRGEASDIYSSTPNSTGYYHLTKSYWANGAVETLGGIPGVPTINYNVDGEGRPSTVTGSQNLVTITSYNPASQVTGVTFGSQDSDTYQYDSADRMKQYSFNVNGSSVIGQPTWNTNGTLQKLQITQDPFNPANVQTCTYTYDALGRLGGKDANGYSVNCGSTWAQTFTFDPFGNITKTGSSSWTPTYATPTNNQYKSLWNGITYDAKGNLTYDTFHHYQWDAWSHMTTNDTSTFIYDALGNLAEASWGDQYLYDENGKMLAGSHAQAPAYFAHIPLPGGAIAGYSNGNLTAYTHADWLGSVRFSSTPNRGLNYDVAFAPFGEPYASPQVSNIFAGMEQIVATDEYETPNREYNTTQGRWITPDPAGLAAADPTNPQSWNRYAYVLNNPLSFVDPTGLDCVYLNDAGTGVDNNGIDHDSSMTDCNSTGGYWIWGNVDSPSSLTIDSINGIVSGYGLDAFGNVMFSIAGAAGSNSWGAWSQTFVAGGAPLDMLNGPANNFPTVGAAPHRPRAPSSKPGCTKAGLSAGLKAAAGDFFTPPGADPLGDVGDALRTRTFSEQPLGLCTWRPILPDIWHLP